jgi:prepilin-type N-terminal cleavage/methylation domain-containing protein
MGRVRLADERGFTLIEMVVAVASGSVLIAATLMFVQVAVKTQVETSARIAALQLGRAAVNDITRSLRAQICPAEGQPAFLAGSDSSVRLWTSVGATTTMREFQFVTEYLPRQQRTITFVPDAAGDKGQIVEQVFDWFQLAWRGNWVSLPDIRTDPQTGQPTFVPKTRVIADGVKRITGTPFLRYYTSEGTSGRATLQLPTPLSNEDLRRVVRVEVAFETTTDRRDQAIPSLRFENSATARMADVDSQENTQPCP